MSVPGKVVISYNPVSKLVFSQTGAFLPLPQYAENTIYKMLISGFSRLQDFS